MSGGSSGVAGEGTRPRKVDAITRVARHAVRVGEHRELLQVGQLLQVDLFGQLATYRSGHVLVVAQLSARQ